MKKIIKRFYDFVFFFFSLHLHINYTVYAMKNCALKKILHILYIEWHCVREAVYGVLKK